MFTTDQFSLILFLVGLTLLPFMAMVATCYLKIVVVMSLIRNALGVQSIPPNMVINALALILTLYVMAPIVGRSWDVAAVEFKDPNDNITEEMMAYAKGYFERFEYALQKYDFSTVYSLIDMDSFIDFWLLIMIIKFFVVAKTHSCCLINLCNIFYMRRKSVCL